MDRFDFILEEVVDVVSRVTTEYERLEVDVEGELRARLNPLRTGSWTGEGAESFYDEMETRVLKEVAALLLAIAGIRTSIGRAEDIILTTDQDNCRIVGDVLSAYENIRI